MRIRILTKKSARNCAILVLSVVFFNGLALSEERENFKSKISFIILGGLRYMRVGDTNIHLESFDGYVSEMTDYEGGMIKKLANYNSELEKTPEFELRLDISPKFAISAGIGFITEKNESNFQFTDQVPSEPINFHTISTEPKVSATLLKLGTYYTIPLIRRVNLFLNGGINYYFSKVSLYKSHGFHAEIDLSPYFKEDKYDVSSNNFGLYGGMGFEYKISNYLALAMEFRGRYAKMKNLKGTRLFRNGRHMFPPPEESEEGILYIGERYMTDGWIDGYRPDLIISPSRPSGAEFRNIREAALDLSGYSLRLGIRIKLL
jgi:opacity protein-like surface antigen